MTDLAVVVPIKALDQAKQRQAPFLSPGERAGLVQAMASDVLAAVGAATTSENLFVCCGDQSGAELGRRVGANVLIDEQSGLGLNAIIRQVAQRLGQAGWARLLVVHADLPALAAEDVRVAGDFGRDDLLLVADHNGTGSNLLGWGLHTAFAARYGEGSYQRHRTLAAQLGLRIRSPHLPWATLDMDRPEDLQRLLASPSDGRAAATRAWLSRTPLRERLQSASQSL